MQKPFTSDSFNNLVMSKNNHHKEFIYTFVEQKLHCNTPRLSFKAQHIVYVYSSCQALQKVTILIKAITFMNPVANLV